jgi:cytochrome oxidase Cu insertion factor (SCO1/SenC/PrrC family)
MISHKTGPASIGSPFIPFILLYIYQASPMLARSGFQPDLFNSEIQRYRFDYEEVCDKMASRKGDFNDLPAQRCLLLTIRWQNKKEAQQMIKLFMTTLLLISVIIISPAIVFTAGAATLVMQQNKPQYVCPMDSDVKASKPGKCRKCGMALRKADVEGASAPVAGAEGGTSQAAGSQTPQQIPDTTVYDQNGRKLRFYTDLVKGKTVAINFIFTTCTTICPPLTATFRKVQQELSNRVGRDVELISVSVDPTIDVPERLNSFAAKFKVQPGWTFVTGSKPEIDQLLRALGAFVSNKNDHTPMILIGNDGAG